MPCGVTADLIEVLDNDTVRISGSFDGVQSFGVRIVGLTDRKSATLDGTTWSIEYSGSEITGDLTEFRETLCDREAEYVVGRPLFGNSELPPCQGTATVRVQCDTSPVGCPDVSVRVRPGGCNIDDTERLMTFEVTVPDGATIQYMWAFGDASPVTGTNTRTGDFSDSHPYAAGDTYFANLIIIDPSGCPPLDPIPVVVNPCGEQACPEVRWSADIAPESECESGQRAVTVTVTITLPGHSITASMLDGQSEVIAEGTAFGDLTLESPELMLGGGDHDFSVQIDGNLPDDCRPDLLHTVSVPDCPGTDPGKQVCPTVEWDFDVSSTCNQDGTRDVTVVATVTSSGAPVAAELRDPQGNALDSGTTPATLNSGTLMLAPGIHQFTTVLTDGLPIGCTQEETDTVTVPECEDGPEGCGCNLLRILGLVFLVVGLVLVIGGVCSVVPPIAILGAVLALIGAVLLIWWALCCASVGCRALERLISSINLLIVAFTVIAAVLAIIAAIAAVAGNPLGLGCAGAAASSAGYLGTLNIILFCIFLNRGCVWQADSPFR